MKIVRIYRIVNQKDKDLKDWESKGSGFKRIKIERIKIEGSKDFFPNYRFHISFFQHFGKTTFGQLSTSLCCVKSFFGLRRSGECTIVQSGKLLRVDQIANGHIVLKRLLSNLQIKGGKYLKINQESKIAGWYIKRKRGKHAQSF